MTLLEKFQRINFGNPDGLYDYHLSEYFYDQGYWNKIIKSDKFYVIGRKGTGKSAIYRWLESKQIERGTIVSNLSFNNFPFEKLLQLSDDDFSRPNQYQSIWKYIILTELCKQITLDERERVVTDALKEIMGYVNFRFGRELNELHSTITNKANKTTIGITIQGIGTGFEDSTGTQYSLSELINIREINLRLERLVFSYLAQSGLSYYVQFDQLDDNYTLYINNRKYFESIISLFKVIYEFNNKIKAYSNNCKVIAYLRTDIFRRFPSVDSDSAKFNFHAYKLNWNITSRSDWKNPELKKVINLRIRNSTDMDVPDPFSLIFDTRRMNIIQYDDLQDPFVYIVNRTFYRPRDIIQFCIDIQEEVERRGMLDRNTLLNAEKNYSTWLLDELSNEIAPVLGPTDPLFAFLRTLGSGLFTYGDFVNAYSKRKLDNVIKKSPNQLLRFLYENGIICNINKKDNRTEVFSIIRNESSQIDNALKIALHQGMKKGLNTYTI